MKNKLIVLLGILLVAAGVLFVVARHNERQQQVTAQVAANNVAIEKAKAEVATAQQDIIEMRDGLKVQCQVGVDAWNKLTPALQKTQAKPDCALSFR